MSNKDDELRHRLEILKTKLENGEIRVAEHLAQGVRDSLGKVRYGPDGKIDLNTVDGRIRSMAMAAAMAQDRQDMKSAASLLEIQQGFYSRITPMFEDIHRVMIEHKQHPQSVSWALSKDEEFVQKNHPLIAPFIAELEEFWEVVAEPASYHIQDNPNLKGVFGGDLFPSYERNIASSVGLYLDTVILTDPFMNTAALFPRWPKSEAVRFFLKHGLQLMNYRPLALADLDVPIVAILPFQSSVSSSYRDTLFEAAASKATIHASEIFERKFANLDELHEFLGRMGTVEDVIKETARHSRLLFDTEWTEKPGEMQLRRAMKEHSHTFSDHVGEMVFNQCFGRMSQATDLSWKALSLGGVPLIDAETSWTYFNWSLEYDAHKASDHGEPQHLTRAMQRAAESEMQWIGKIPADALIEIRKEGAAAEIRAMLTEGVQDIIDLDRTNFEGSAAKVIENIESAFSDHQKRIDELKSKKWKFATHDIGSWLVTGSIDIAAAALGNPAWGLASIALSQVSDAPKLKELPGKWKDIQREQTAISTSAAGMLFKHR